MLFIFVLTQLMKNTVYISYIPTFFHKKNCMNNKNTMVLATIVECGVLTSSEEVQDQQERARVHGSLTTAAALPHHRTLNNNSPINQFYAGFVTEQPVSCPALRYST